MFCAMGQVQSRAEKESGPWCLSQQRSGLARAGLWKRIPQWLPKPRSPISLLQLPGATHLRGIPEARRRHIGCLLPASGTCPWAESSLSQPYRRPPGFASPRWSTWGSEGGWRGTGSWAQFTPGPAPLMKSFPEALLLLSIFPAPPAAFFSGPSNPQMQALPTSAVSLASGQAHAACSRPLPLDQMMWVPGFPLH